MIYDRRTEFVRALRQVADLIEGNPALPVPTWAFLQASAAELARGEQERFAAVRQFADQVHVGVTMNPRTGARRACLHLPPAIQYSLTATPDQWPTPVDLDSPDLDDVLVLAPGAVDVVLAVAP